MKTNRSMEVWAHRGFSRIYPENTLAAFEAAIQCGVHGLELDVHLSRDGQLIVIHDERLERTTNGHGLVKDATVEELKRLDAGSWLDPKFKGLQIPTLDEVCTLVQRLSTLKLNIELKTDVYEYPAIEQRAWQLVQYYGLQDRVIFSSFNHYTLKRLKTNQPAAHIGLLYTDRLFEPWRYACFMNANALHPYFKTLNADVVKQAHASGIRVHAWTVNDVEDIEWLYALGVDALMTDEPDVALRTIGS